jgi:CRP/FNR family transcriptional regulator, anaerobic regulatory protein
MTILMPGSIHAGHDCTHGKAEHVCATCQVRELSVCGALEPESLVAFERLSRTFEIDAKMTLFTEGDTARHVFNITEGVVRLYKMSPDGRRQIVGFALPGDFLGLALSDSYGVSADAVTQVTACKFIRTSFVDYLDEHPKLMRRLHEFASHELSLARDQMMLIGRHTAEERLAAFLLNLSERYKRIGESGVTIQLPMSRQDIADFLALTIETVSRTFSKLVKAKLIVIVPEGARLLNADGLHKLARVDV